MGPWILYTLLVFCFLLFRIWNNQIIDIWSFSSQLYKIIIDYLLMLAKVTPKQDPGAILIRK